MTSRLKTERNGDPAVILESEIDPTLRVPLCTKNDSSKLLERGSGRLSIGRTDRHALSSPLGAMVDRWLRPGHAPISIDRWSA